MVNRFAPTATQVNQSFFRLKIGDLAIYPESQDWLIKKQRSFNSMMEQDSAQTNKLNAGDWTMATISFFLTPIIPSLLSIYNFVRLRRPQALLYLGVLVTQIVLAVLLVIAS